MKNDEIDVLVSVIKENAETVALLCASEHDKRNLHNNVIKPLAHLLQQIKERNNA